MLKPARALAAIALVALALAAEATAAPGDPDPTFSGDGFALIDFQKQWETGAAIVAAPDGKVVLSGYWEQGIDRVHFLARLLPDGSLDTGFGVGGISTYPADCGGNNPFANIKVLADGRVLAGGGCGGDFFLARFMPDGNLDTGFDGDPGNPGGGNGIVRTSFPEEVAALRDGDRPRGRLDHHRRPVLHGRPALRPELDLRPLPRRRHSRPGLRRPAGQPGRRQRQGDHPARARDGRPSRRPGRGGRRPRRLRRRESAKTRWSG